MESPLILLLFLLVHGQAHSKEFNESSLQLSVPIKAFMKAHINQSTITSADICDQPTSTRNLVFSIFCGAVAIFGILGNTAVVFVIVVYPDIRRQNRFLILASLAAADAGVSLFVTTLKTLMYANNGNFCNGIATCSFFQITDTLFPISSMTHIFVLSVDRWYAIAMPYEYINRVSPMKIKRVLLFIWIYSAVWVILGTFKWNAPVSISYEILTVATGRYCFSHNRYYITVLLVFIFFIPTLAIAVLSCGVVHYARKISRAKCSHLECGKREKVFKAVTLVVSVYIICWLPHCVIVVLSYWWGKLLYEFAHHSPIAYDVVTSTLSNILPTLHSSVNPFIYCFFSREFQIAIKDLVRRWLGQPRYWSAEYSMGPVQKKSCAEGGKFEMTCFPSKSAELISNQGS